MESLEIPLSFPSFFPLVEMFVKNILQFYTMCEIINLAFMILFPYIFEVYAFKMCAGVRISH